MVIERAELYIKPGEEQRFESAVREAVPVLKRQTGAHGVKLLGGVEAPTTFLLLIEWDAVDDHVAFTRTEDFEKFKGLLGGFYAQAPNMEHFNTVIDD